jgi:hypothetical protein
MKPWERKLFDWGLLGYLVRDVIGAGQEESFGIRQNHTMYLSDWHRLVTSHFSEWEYDVFVPERGWGERVMKRLAVALDPHHSDWRAARLLGGTLAGFCRKRGAGASACPERFEALLRCPDCAGTLERDATDTLCCGCGYEAPNEGGVYNLLRSADRAELYPGDRDDIIDFSLPSHEAKLRDGWYELEGVFGNKYRWIGPQASACLRPVRPGAQCLRVRGHAHEKSFTLGRPVTVEVSVNGAKLIQQTLDRSGLFILEAPVPSAPEYRIDIAASPTFDCPPDDRIFSVNISMIRLVPAE